MASKWPANSISLGRREGGEPIILTPDDRATHTWILGASDSGKSRLMEYMIRQDIHFGHGGMLIDPHGSLFESVMRWLMTYPEYFERGKIVLFEPGNANWVVGYNPLDMRGKGKISVCVDTLHQAVKTIFDEHEASTPRLDRVLPNAMAVLAELGLTLYESQYLVDFFDGDIRANLLAQVQDENVRRNLEKIDRTFAKKPERYLDYMESSDNRFDKFVKNETIQHVIGQSERVLDLRQLMDEGYFVLADFGNRDNQMSPADAQILGTLLLNDLYLAAVTRSPNYPKPFYLYIDEASDFLNGDIEQILTRTRKFGLHLTLANQGMYQCNMRNEWMAKALLNGAQTKIVLRIKDTDDADYLARQLNPEIDLAQYRKGLTTPMVTGQQIQWLKSRGRAKGSADGVGTGSAGGASELQDAEGNILLGSSDQDSESRIHIDTETETESEHQALVSKIEEREYVPKSMDEIFHEIGNDITGQDTGVAIISYPTQLTSHQFHVHHVDEHDYSEEEIEAAKDEHYRTRQLVRSTRAEVVEEIATRQRQLREGVPARSQKVPKEEAYVDEKKGKT